MQGRGRTSVSHSVCTPSQNRFANTSRDAGAVCQHVARYHTRALKLELPPGTPARALYTRPPSCPVQSAVFFSHLSGRRVCNTTVQQKSRNIFG